MHFLNFYYQNIIKYDIYNKFYIKKIDQITKLKKIILNFSTKNSNITQILCFLVTLELISSQKGCYTRSKVTNITFRIQKGDVIGCKVTLRKNRMYSFFSNFVLNILPTLKQFNGFHISANLKNSVTFKFKNMLLFSELLNQYDLFKQLPPLNITFVSSENHINQFIYLLRSFKLPITKIKYKKLDVWSSSV